MKNTKKISESSIFLWGKLLLQRIIITIQFYEKKGLANHAAGGAYGFLLSAAPTLLLAAIFLLIMFRSSPHTITNLIQQDIPFLEIIFNESWITDNIITISRSGIPGVFSVVSIIWAGRIFALTLQRGLLVVFSGLKKRNPVKEFLITLLIQLGVLVFIFGLIISSRTVMFILDNIKYLPKIIYDIFGLFRYHVLPFVALGIITYCGYRIIPANPPQRLSALRGTFFCIIPYSVTYLALQFIINKTRYNFLYGTLGDLIILLVGVYFFFMFFFMGAQFANIRDSLEVLLFSNLLNVRKKSAGKRKNLLQKLFFSPGGPLVKYLRLYKQGEIIINEGEKGNEVFYLLDGQVTVLLSKSEKTGKPAPVLDAGVFFGEMEHLLSDRRTATVKAKTDVSVLAVPPKLFDDVLKSDAGIDRTLIENLTQRLKDANERGE